MHARDEDGLATNVPLYLPTIYLLSEIVIRVARLTSRAGTKCKWTSSANMDFDMCTYTSWKNERERMNRDTHAAITTTKKVSDIHDYCLVLHSQMKKQLKCFICLQWLKFSSGKKVVWLHDVVWVIKEWKAN